MRHLSRLLVCWILLLPIGLVQAVAQETAATPPSENAAEATAADLAGQATPAEAAAPAEEETATTIQVAGYLGWHRFAPDASLGKVDTGSGSALDASLRFGLRFAVLLWPSWLVELELDSSSTQRSDGASSSVIIGLRPHVVFDLMATRIRPFLLAGPTLLFMSPANPALEKTDFGLAGEFGVGAKFDVDDWWGVRLDLRSQVQSGITQPVFEFAALLGLYGQFPTPPRLHEPPVIVKEADRDGDGLVDELDRCPDEKGELELFGCTSEDLDGDGLNQVEDKCPRAVGPRELNGCPPGDSDGDKVLDPDDECPTQAGDPANGGCAWPDQDEDRVADKDDKCPEEKGKYGYKGCTAKDDDNDGVLDFEDRCPGVKGLKEIAGCTPEDKDGDNVQDHLDKCLGVKGIAELAGCPDPDKDADEVPDRFDKCPDLKGIKELSGCPDPDTDGDGQPDRKDKCPSIKGIRELDGCPDPDRDGDGIADRFDKCPDRPGAGSKRKDGCPNEVPTEVVEFFGFVGHIDFEPGSAVLAAKSMPVLDNAAVLIKKFPGFRVEISGHTDNTGNATLNRRISLQRAQTVRRYLVDKGVPSKRLVPVGNGPDRPIADNATPEGRKFNRRVEFKLIAEAP